MTARPGSEFCRVHASDAEFLNRTALPAIGGAIIGNLLAPGIGGAIVGGLAGIALHTLPEDDDMPKKKVFVSFDFDNDRTLKEFIIGQSIKTDSPFNVIDTSLKEAAPLKSWEAKAELAIRRSELVLVMVGPNTHRAPGVLKEVAMARRNGIPLVQVIGYKDGNYTPVPDAGRLYRWNWENLKKLLS